MSDQTIAAARIDIIADASTFEAEIRRAQGRLSSFSAESQEAYGKSSAATKRAMADVEKFVLALGRTPEEIRLMNAAMRGAPPQFLEEARQQIVAFRAQASVASEEARKMVEQEKRLAADRSFIKGLQDRSNAIGKTTADILEMQAAERGLSAQAAPFIARLREQETAQRGVGVSSKEMAWAMRGVPAQISDIAVSLQGGMPVMTVFMQQGLQLRDMFHGWVPAAKALGSTLLGMINPFTVAAAAAGALAYGYYQGAKEGEEFRKTLIMTNGAIGVSAAELQGMAARLDEMVGTHAKAAEVLGLFARETTVASSRLQRYTQTTIEWERATGQSAEEIVKQFSELQNEPLKASEKLNTSMRYLTGETYRQIRALEEAGQKTQAANLAQQEYDRVLRERTPHMLENLGYVERAWRAIRDTGAEAISGILSVGRDASPEASLRELQKQYSDRYGGDQSASSMRVLLGDTVGAYVESITGGSAETPGAKALKQEIALLQAVVDERALADKARQESERARALGVEREGYILDGRTKSQLQSAELAAERDKWERLSAGLEEGSAKYRELYAAHQENVKKIEEKYKGSGKSAADELKRSIDSLLGKTGANAYAEWSKQVTLLDQLFASGRITQDEYARGLQVVGQEYASAALAADELTQAEMRQAEMAKVLSDLRIQQSTTQAQFMREIASFGQGDRVRELNADLAKVEDRYRSLIESRRNSAQGLSDSDLAAIRVSLQTELDMVREFHDRKLAIQQDWRLGARDALTNYADDAMNVYSSVGNAAQSMFKGMEDAIVQAVKTGKTSFSDLANSIIEDMIRITVQQSITGPLAGALGNVMGSWFGGGGFSTPQQSVGGSIATVDLTRNALGGVYDSPSLSAYSGGVYDKPQFFAFAKGAGVFGEAGPEAIMPLRRGSDGSLGVRAELPRMPTVQASMPQVIVNIQGAQGEPEVTTRRDQNGNLNVDLIWKQVSRQMAGEVASGQGQFVRSIERRYALTPKLG